MLKRLLLMIITIIVILSMILASIELSPYFGVTNQHQQSKLKDFHVGVSFGGNTTGQAKLLIDKVKAYTNLFVVQSGPVSGNETAMNEVVNYAVAQGLDVIAYFGYFNPNYPWQVPWLDYAKQQWGSHFLGVYLNDEPGGQVLDANWTGYFNQIRIRNTSNYRTHTPSIDLALNGSIPFDSYQASQVAYHFFAEWHAVLGLSQLQSRSINSFTSDYALYWFDYLVGYDTIFAEFGSNQTAAQATQAMALTRGAARMQNKTWGTIITWTYDKPPYIENASEMYNQLMASYIAGSNYSVIFDYPQIEGNPYGILTEDHFAALEKFWNKIKTQEPNNLPNAALVLPHDYGWGMRNPQDLIWGLWKPDSTSDQIWNVSQRLLSAFGFNLDIVYEDQQFPVQGKYHHIYYWNQTL